MKKENQTEIFEKAIKESKDNKYVLRLYIAGQTPKSSQAITNIKKVCDEHLKGRYKLEVIDIYQQPTLAEGEQIVAVPTLVKKLPLPLRRFIGTMADQERILMGLDLITKKADSGIPPRRKLKGSKRE